MGEAASAREQRHASAPLKTRLSKVERRTIATSIVRRQTANRIAPLGFECRIGFLFLKILTSPP
jgi:hypothetical protein